MNKGKLFLGDKKFLEVKEMEYHNKFGGAPKVLTYEKGFNWASVSLETLVILVPFNTIGMMWMEIIEWGIWLDISHGMKRKIYPLIVILSDTLEKEKLHPMYSKFFEIEELKAHGSR